MNLNKLVEIIIKIRNDEEKNVFDYLEKYTQTEILKLDKKPEQLVIILNEISKKLKQEIKDIVYTFLKLFYDEKIHSEKTLDILTPFFNSKMWKYISEHQKLSESFIEKHADKVDWYYISLNQNLSEKFIDKHSNKVNWDIISVYKQLPEKLIEKHADKLNWLLISMYQNLSEEFIEKYTDKVDWEMIFKYQNLTDKFKKKHEWRIEK